MEIGNIVRTGHRAVDPVGCRRTIAPPRIDIGLFKDTEPIQEERPNRFRVIPANHLILDVGNSIDFIDEACVMLGRVLEIFFTIAHKPRHGKTFGSTERLGTSCV